MFGHVRIGRSIANIDFKNIIGETIEETIKNIKSGSAAGDYYVYY